MLDTEALGEHVLQLPGAELRVVQRHGLAEHDVRRQRRVLAARRPQMQVVHGLDAGLAVERAAHRGRVESGRHGFEQNARRLAHQMPCRDDDQRGDQERCDRVEAIGVEQRDADARDDHRERTTRVGGEVPHRGAQVQVVAGVTADDDHAPEVHDEAEYADDRDGQPSIGTGSARRRTASTATTIAPSNSSTAFASATSTSVRPKPNVWRSVGGRGRDAQRGVREGKGNDIGDHVHRIGEHRERAERETADHLHDEEGGVGNQRDDECASPGVDARNYRVCRRSACARPPNPANLREYGASATP